MSKLHLKMAVLLFVVVAIQVAPAGVVPAKGAEVKGLTESGKPDLQSAGPLAFGPEGVLFIGDPQGGAVFAIGVDPAPQAAPIRELKLDGIDRTIAGLLGTTPAEILVNDIAVQPSSSQVFISLSRGRGPDAIPVLVRVDGAGKLGEVPLDNVRFAKVTLGNVPASDAKDVRGNKLRQESITDLAYVDGRVFIAGLSNEEFASKLRAIPFPFKTADSGASVEIFHGAHGQLETRSPVRTFVPFDIGGNPHILAAYTCTPLAKFPVSDLKAGEKVRGVTVAELGNRNRPLDMIVYKRDGRNHLLVANSNRGVMKVTTDHIDTQTPITQKIDGTAGLSYETVSGLKGVEQLDKLNDESAIVLIRTEAGTLNLETVSLP